MVVVVDFANTVPPPLTAALVQLAPVVAAARHALQIASWQRSWYDAWLAVAAWWGVCVLSDVTLRYLLPVVLLAVLWLPRRPRSPPTTEQGLQNIVSDLTTIHALLPKKPAVLPSLTLLRIATVTYVPYLLAVRLVPLRILIALIGTGLLTARAPFTRVILDVLHRSAWLRWSIRRLLSFVTGHPLPPIFLSQQPTPTSPSPVPALRFLFTIYENQRWWMGLDWTAALLPGERPSWCTPAPAHLPVSPPNAFALPAPTTVFLSNGKGGRVKRTATWSWEEPEWKVVIHRDGGPLSRVERPIPEDNPIPPGSTGTTSSRLLKAAGKMRESGIMGGGNGTSQSSTGEGEIGVAEEAHEEAEEDNVTTDPDGWVYGDNKWEGSSNKGGMGKYTRYRRWTRVATVSETVEVVEDGPVGIVRPDPPIPPSQPETFIPGQDVHALGTMTSSPPEEESPLRQRLRRALSKPSNPT